MSDEIIRELRRIKDELAREANYDVHVLCRRLRERQSTACGPLVDRSGDALGLDSQTRKDDGVL
jgi:hypothetical protein